MQAVVAQWVEQWRASMVRFAYLHLSSVDDAEDVVQETFAAVLSADRAALPVRRFA